MEFLTALRKKGLTLQSNMDTESPAFHANVLITIMYLGKFNMARLRPDGSLGKQFDAALQELYSMDGRKMEKILIVNMLINALKGFGCNHRKLSPDNKLGKEFKIALKELRAKLAKVE